MTEHFAAPLTPHAIKSVLADIGVRPSKTRGQSFLASRALASRIADAADISRNDAVLEVGAGLGALTAELLRRAGSVIAIESDKRLAGWLHDRLGMRGNFELISADALSVDLGRILRRMMEKGSAVKIVSNIPYSISGPLISKILREGEGMECCALTVQAELGRRITARPGGKEYGAFSVLCQYYAEVSAALSIPPSAFYPAPSVISEVVVFRPRPRRPLPLADEKLFFCLVRLLFSQRRKTIGTILKRALGERCGPQRISEAFSMSAIDRMSRAEQLSLEQFAILSRNLREELSDLAGSKTGPEVLL